MIRAVFIVARAELRRRWPAALVLAVLVGMTAGVVLAAVAGVRRTVSAVDRFMDVSLTSEIQLEMAPGTDMDAILARVESVAGVDAVSQVALFPVDVGTEFDFGAVASPDPRWGDQFDRPRVLDGRLPESGTEIALNEQAVTQLGVDIGDSIGGGTFTPPEYDSLVRDGVFIGFSGPDLVFEVVGVVRQARDLPDDPRDANPSGLTGPGFYAEEEARVGAFDLWAFVDVADGADPEVVARSIEAALPAGSEALLVFPRRELPRLVDDAVRVLAIGVAAFAGVAFAAGAVFAAQAIGRHVDVFASDLGGLHALGVSRTGRTLAIWLAAVPAAVVGSLLAGGVMLALSPLFPFGVAGRAEPHPGVALDWTVLGAGGAAVLFLTAGWTGVVAWRVARLATRTGSTRRRSAVALRAMRVPRGVAFATGARLALERTGGRPSVPARTAIVGSAIGIAGIVAALGFGASEARLAASPERWGRTWDRGPIEYIGEPDAAAVAAAYTAVATDPGVLAGGTLAQSYVHLGALRVPAASLEVGRGDIPIPIVEGRAPATQDEVALGTATMQLLDVGIGGEVAVTDGGALVIGTAHVVGRALIPDTESNGRGEGAFFTPTGLEAFGVGERTERLVIRYAPDADSAAVDARLAAIGFEFSVYSEHNAPQPVTNLHEVRWVPRGLAVFFAFLGLGGLGHAVTVSSRRRLHEFAVLEALGFQRRQVRSAIRWQAALIVVAGLAAGVPLGVALGRWAWSRVATDIGVADDLLLPSLQVLATVAGALVTAALVAGTPGWLATRRLPAAVLRQE